MARFLLPAALSILLFELFVWLKMRKDLDAIVERSYSSMRILAATDIGDEEKGVLTRRGSVEILKATFSLSAKLLLAGSLLYAAFMLATFHSPVLRQEVLGGLLSPALIVLLTGVVMCHGWARKLLLRRLQRPAVAHG